jgi:hypothetical protein
MPIMNNAGKAQSSDVVLIVILGLPLFIFDCIAIAFDGLGLYALFATLFWLSIATAAIVTWKRDKQ